MECGGTILSVKTFFLFFFSSLRLSESGSALNILPTLQSD